MSQPQPPHSRVSYLGQGWSYLRNRAAAGLQVMRVKGPSKLQFWVLALMIGIGAGFAALGFRLGISALQEIFYGADDYRLASVAADLPWWWLMLVPIAGGLVVGLILHWFTADGRVRAVADVIEGAALDAGRVERREGLASALASLITLSTGGSSGREGPVVHLAGVVSSWVADRIKASPMTGRELLGCAVAGAVAASFNAPIGGALFAHEVILRHFSIRAFAPIAISAVAGTVINRLNFGGATEFTLIHSSELAFYVELPAFMGLGLICALVAGLLIWSIFRAEKLATRLFVHSGWPRWLRPTMAGVLLGAIAVPFPHIIGVGYETTWDALNGSMGFWQVVVFALVKMIAVAVTLGGRMGGGVFSPALVLGALTGLAYGMVVTAILPHMSGGTTIYALAGMGAVAAAVLGAPISTALIIFELTGDWQTGLAVMTTISLSSALASRLYHRSFFLTQLELRGISIAEGPQVWLPQKMRIGTLIRPLESDKAPAADLVHHLAQSGSYLMEDVSLELALAQFSKSGAAFLPVMRPSEPQERDPDDQGPDTLPDPEIIGVLYHIDALQALNRAMAETAAEEHG